MSVGELAGLLAAIALCVLVALAAVPLIKAGRALDEVRIAVRDLGHHSVPVLVELRAPTTSWRSCPWSPMTWLVSPVMPAWSANMLPTCLSCSQPPWAAP